MGDVNHEPTMEEILASIKKIIAEDGETAASEPDVRSRRRRAAPVVLEALPEESVADDVLELTDQFEAEPTEIETDEEPIASDDAIRASQAALAALSAIANPVAQDGNADEAHPLEGLVREMLRPMLKEWIDGNLPGLVEDMVAREIAKIAAHRG
jgi:cell pole-organizing protein PopZ